MYKQDFSFCIPKSMKQKAQFCSFGELMIRKCSKKMEYLSIVTIYEDVRQSGKFDKGERILNSETNQA